MIALALVRHLELAVESRERSGQLITLSASLLTLCRLFLLAAAQPAVNQYTFNCGQREGNKWISVQPAPSPNSQEMEALLGRSSAMWVLWNSKDNTLSTEG